MRLGDRNIKYLGLCPGGIGNELDKEAGRAFPLWKGLRCFLLSHIVDAGFRRGGLGPPDKVRVAARSNGTMNTNLGKMFTGANLIAVRGNHNGIGQFGWQLRMVDIAPPV